MEPTNSTSSSSSSLPPLESHRNDDDDDDPTDDDDDPTTKQQQQRRRRDLLFRSMIHKEIQHVPPRRPLPLNHHRRPTTTTEPGHDDDADHNTATIQPKSAAASSDDEKEMVDLPPPASPPKAPLYAYELFQRDYLRAYQKANRDAASLEALNAMTGTEWNRMSEAAKKPYVTRATQDQQIYRQQLKQWEQQQAHGSSSSSSSSAANNNNAARPRRPTHDDSTDPHHHTASNITTTTTDLVDPTAAADNDDRWYSQLQSTPPPIGSSSRIDPSDGRPTNKAPSVTTTVVQPPRQQQQQQSILNPKRPPKINQDGSYRKPGGPQPVGYQWNAEYGYWESIGTTTTSERRDDAPRRRRSTGNAPPRKKRKYNPDGSIVPYQTLERLPDGTYARPMGRPIVGYSWDGTRGLWIPESPMEPPQRHRHSLPTMEPTSVVRRATKAGNNNNSNKTRLYTSDGCILPVKTPTKADDGSFVRPFGRSIVGYTWDHYRGVWAPTGAPMPTKNAMPLPPSHFTGPIARPVSLFSSSSSSSLADQETDGQFVACRTCAACRRNDNCGTCLHCRILKGRAAHPVAAAAAVPYLVCAQRICQEPVEKPSSCTEVSGNDVATDFYDDDIDEFDDDDATDDDATDDDAATDEIQP